MPKEKRDELLTISRLGSLPFKLSKKNKQWLESLRHSKNEAIREMAEMEFEIRRNYRSFDDFWENAEFDEEIPEDFDEDDLPF